MDYKLPKIEIDKSQFIVVQKMVVKLEGHLPCYILLQ